MKLNLGVIFGIAEGIHASQLGKYIHLFRETHQRHGLIQRMRPGIAHIAAGVGFGSLPVPAAGKAGKADGYLNHLAQHAGSKDFLNLLKIRLRFILILLLLKIYHFHLL